MVPAQPAPVATPEPAPPPVAEPPVEAPPAPPSPPVAPATPAEAPAAAASAAPLSVVVEPPPAPEAPAAPPAPPPPAVPATPPQAPARGPNGSAGHPVPNVVVATPRAPATTTTAAPPLVAAPVEDERRLVTVLFGDVSGFTAMSEKLDPEDMKTIMDNCLKGLADQVAKYDGTVDKFEGDLIMAIWGAPVAHEDDAERAVLAAWGMQEFLAKFSRDLERRRGFTLRMRIGVNTGEVIAGTVGSKRDKDYTVMGDVVNTASRFESNARPGKVMVGLKTYNLTKHLIEYEVLEPITVKGKSEPLPVFEVAGVKVDRGQRRGIAGMESPMVGRQEELHLLVATYRQMLASHQPHRLTLVAMPGMGKSRLLTEFQTRVQAEDLAGSTWLKGRSLPYGQGITFHALGEMLKSAFAILDSDPLDTVRSKLLDGLRELIERAVQAGGAPVQGSVEDEATQVAHRLAYALGVSFSDSRVANINPANIKDELYWAWRQFFLRWSETGPLVLIFEDLHWADDIILELVQRLLASIAGRPIFLLCLTRPELLERLPEWGQGANETLARLQPLTRAQSLQLLENLLAPNRLPRKWKERVADQSGGVPFYLEELIRVLLENGGLARGPSGWTISQSEKQVELPDSVIATVSARLDNLPNTERNLLQSAAVVGDTFWESALAYPAAYLESDGVMTLWSVVNKEWVFEKPQTAFVGDRELGFQNTLTRDVAYNGLTRARRSREHRRIGQWLEQHAGDRVSEAVETLAHHYSQAVPTDLLALGGDFDPVLKAIHYGWVAGERARLRQSYADAAARLERVLTSVRDLAALDDEGAPREVYGTPLALVESQVALAQALAQEPLGQYEAALRNLEVVITDGQQQGLTQLVGTALQLKGKILRQQGDLATAEATAREAADLLAQAGDVAGQAQAVLVIGEIASDQAELAKFEETVRQAIDLARQAQSRWVEARGLALLGTALVYRGRVDEAEGNVRGSVETYREMADRRGRATSLTLHGRIQHMRGHMDEALAALEEALAVFEELGDRRSQASASVNLGLIYFEQGNLEQARMAAERGRVHASAIKESAMHIRSLHLLSQIEVESELWEAARDHLTEAESQCLAHDQKSILPEIYRTLGQAYLGLGDLEQAEHYARQGREVVAEDDAYSQGTTWLVLGKVLTTAGQDPEGEAAFQHGITAIEESEEQYEIGMGHEWYAEFLLQRSRTAEAREHLEQARQAYENLNSTGRVQRVAAQLEQLGG
ncbi:MAG: tetratricopeptide repeat protein [Chloroflexi bacterium]|nr:tetratricopeptide repeat protein [Chloroflexota bacterium]